MKLELPLALSSVFGLDFHQSQKKSSTAFELEGTFSLNPLIPLRL